MSVQFQLKNSSKGVWIGENPILAAGEPGVETDTGQMKCGDGVSAWNALPYVSAGATVSAPPNSLITSTEWLAGGCDAGFPAVFSSGNGLNWVSSSGPNSVQSFLTNSILTLLWTGSQWLAGGVGQTGGPSIVTSSDGIHWEPANGDVFNPYGVCHAIGYNGSQYVAVGSNDFRAASVNEYTTTVSVDGKNWSRVPNDPFNIPVPLVASTGVGNAICWDGHQWIAGGANTHPDFNSAYSTITIATSPDGITWTSYADTPFVGGAVYAIGYNGSQYVFAGTNGGSLFYNSPPGTFTLQVTEVGTPLVGQGNLNLIPVANDPFGSGNAYGVAWNGQKWLAVGSSIGPGVTFVSDAYTAATSSDGLNWTPSSPFGNGIGYGVAWSGNKWALSGTNVAPGATSPPTITNVYSEDGVIWNNGNTTVSYSPDSVQYCVAVKNTLAGVPIPRVVASGVVGSVQLSDGNGNFVSFPAVSYTSYDNRLNVPTLHTNSIVARGRSGSEGQVLSTSGGNLIWVDPSFTVSSGDTFTYSTANGLVMSADQLVFGSGNTGPAQNIVLTTGGPTLAFGNPLVSGSCTGSVVFLNANTSPPISFGTLDTPGFCVSPVRSVIDQSSPQQIPVAISQANKDFYPMYYNPLTGEIVVLYG